MKIAIIDDFDEDRMIISKHLHQYFQKTSCLEPISIEQFSSGEQFLHIFEKCAYELILIDYYLPTMNGLEIARAIRKFDPFVYIIFITTSSDFAIDGYKVRAVDYIVKPPSYRQIAEALSLINLTKLQNSQYIQVTCGRDEIKVLLKDIIYCDAAGHYVQIHLQGSHLLRSRTSFTKFIKTLTCYPQFLLCYRGCLVNMEQIMRIENLDFLMNGGERIPIRQKEYAQLTKTYYNYIFAKTRSCK